MMANVADAAANAAAETSAWALLKALKFAWPFVDGIAYPIALVGGSILLLLYIGSRDPRFSRWAVLMVLLYLCVRIIGSVLGGM